MAWKLPAGLVDEEGVLHRDVVVREMNGYDEEILLNAKGKNFAKVTTKLLQRCTESIGSVEKPSEAAIRGLLAGDRNYLLVAIRVASMGNEVDFEAHCTGCRSQNTITQDLTELTVKDMDAEQGREFDIELPSVVVLPDKTEAKMVTVRFLTGKDQEDLAAMGESNMSGMVNTTLVRTIVSIGDYAHITQEMVKSLSKRNRDTIMLKTKAVTPGIDMTTEIECGSCSAKFSAQVGLENFFVSRVA